MRKSRRRRGMRWANQAAREITPRDYSLSCFPWHLSSLPDACFRFARVGRWRPWRNKSRPSWSRIVEHQSSIHKVTVAHVSSSSTRVSSHRLHHSAKVTSLRAASLPFKRASVFKFISATSRTMSSSSSTPVNPEVVNRVRTRPGQKKRWLASLIGDRLLMIAPASGHLRTIRYRQIDTIDPDPRCSSW